MTLNSYSYQRYTPHLLLPQIGFEGQKKLARAKVLIVGMGGLGCPVALYLTATGVGILGLVDADRIDITNLHRQVLYGIEDIGKLKVDVAKEKLAAMNPDVCHRVYSEWLTADNAEDIIASYDFIVDATDNFHTRYLLNDACLLLNKTLIYGSVFQFEGQVSVFGGKDTPCYRCVYPIPPNPNRIPNCADAGVLGTLPGIIGMVEAQEVIKLILNIGQSLRGRLLLYDGLSAKWQELEISKNKNCPACSNPLTIELKNEDFSLCRRGPFTCPEISAPELKQFFLVPLLRSERGKREIPRGALERGKLDDQPGLLRALMRPRNDENQKPLQNILMLDVRETSVFQLGSLPHAMNIPLDSLETQLSKLSNDRNRMLVVVCQSGSRSKQAVRFLLEKGFKRVFSLRGGMNAWLSEPLIPNP